MPIPTPVSREDRAARRKEIAEFVRDGGSIEDAAHTYNTTLGNVRDICRTHGVELQRNDQIRWDVVAALILERGTMAYFARKFSLSRQRIQQIRDKLIDAGIPLGIGVQIGWKPTRVTQ